MKKYEGISKDNLINNQRAHGLTGHINKNYFLEQWRRVEIWHSACVNPKSLLTDELDIDIIDIYCTFFIYAYHLKDWVLDWLRNNEIFDRVKSTELSNQLTRDFKGNINLKILRDVCDYLKHGKLTRKTTNRLASTISINLAYKNGFVLHVGNQHVKVVEFVNDIYSYWQAFINNNGLSNLKNDYDFGKSLSDPPPE